MREAAAALALLLQCCAAADNNALRYILRTALLFQVMAEPPLLHDGGPPTSTSLQCETVLHGDDLIMRVKET